MAPLRILVAPSGFKESLGPEDAAACIEQGIRRVAGPSEAFVCKMPVHDGGEGFCRAVVSAHRGRLVHVDVTGPVRQPVASHYGIIGGTTAVLDMAAAAGLRLVPRDGRDPTRTTSYGVGQLMKLALDQGCSKIIVGCGDSGTTDAGAGMLQALGARLQDRKGVELPVAAGGGSLVDLDRICLDGLHPRLRRGK